MLRLMALVIGGLNGAGLDGYQPPSEALAEALAAPPTPAASAARGDSRRAEVIEFITAAGGEVG